MHKMMVASNPVFILMLFLVAMLNGCATQPYGSFIQNSSTAYSKVMADDVSAQIMRLYPAANTRFNLQHAVNDPFGNALIENLRMDGFAVQEAVKQQMVDTIIRQPDVEPSRGHALSYVVDQAGDLYHVTIMIGNTQLSRAFIAQTDSIHPAGHWVRKE